MSWGTCLHPVVPTGIGPGKSYRNRLVGGLHKCAFVRPTAEITAHFVTATTKPVPKGDAGRGGKKGVSISTRQLSVLL